MNDLQTQPAIDSQSTRIITVNLPPKADMENRASALLSAADDLIIDSSEMAEIAADELISVKSAYKKLEEVRVLHVSPLNSEVKYINDYFRAALTAMEQAEGSYKRKMLTYSNEQEQKRKEEQARRDNEARIERERLAAENVAREKAAWEESQRKLAEQAAALKAEQDARREASRQQEAVDAARRAGDEAKAMEAERLQTAAREQQAAALALANEAGRAATIVQTEAAALSAANDTAMTIMTAPVVAIAPKLKGISSKKSYKGKVIDKMALVKFIATHPEYLNLVTANDTAINQLAKAQGAALAVDGISVYEEQTLAARRA